MYHPKSSLFCWLLYLECWPAWASKTQSPLSSQAWQFTKQRSQFNPYLNNLDLKLKANFPAWYSLPSIVDDTWKEETRNKGKLFLTIDAGYANKRKKYRAKKKKKTAARKNEHLGGRGGGNEYIHNFQTIFFHLKAVTYKFSVLHYGCYFRVPPSQQAAVVDIG